MMSSRRGNRRGGLLVALPCALAIAFLPGGADASPEVPDDDHIGTGSPADAAGAESQAMAATGQVVAGPGGAFTTYGTPLAVLPEGEQAGFTNLDIASHDVRSVARDDNGDYLFESALVGLGSNVPVEGTEDVAPGTYDFYCSLHPNMTGTLVVVEGSGGDEPPDDPLPDVSPPDDLPPDELPDPDPGDGGGDPEPPEEQSEWPFFGGDLANSRSSEHGPAPDEVLDLEKAWTYETDGEGDFTGTPIVGDGRIYMGAYLGHAIAIDETTGEEIWSVDLNTGEEDATITASAAYHDGEVYLPVSAQRGADHTPYVVALDAATGDELWRTYVNPEQPLGDLYGSPIVWETVDADGDPFRALYIGGSSWDSAIGRDGELHLGYVTALDLDDGGNVLWRTYMAEGGPHTKEDVPENPDGETYDGAAVWSTPALDEDSGLLYAGTGQGYRYAHSLTNSMVQLDAFTGEMGDHYQATPGDAWQFDRQHEGLDADFGASPQLVEGPDGEMWVGAGQKNSHLVYQLTGEEEPIVPVGLARYHMLDREAMELEWRTPVGTGDWLGGITGATAYDGARIYGGAFFGQNFALNKADGSYAWLGSTMDVAHLSHTQVGNGVVYSVSSAGVLHAWDADTGAPLWADQLANSPSASGVAITAGGIYAAQGLQSDSGSVHAYRLPDE